MNPEDKPETQSTNTSEPKSRLDALRERLQSKAFLDGLGKVHEDNYRKHREMFNLPME
jgi:hypothetical protein